VVQEFRLQDPGEAIHEAEIQEVLVSPGDRVEEGQTVFVIETDKAAVEIPVPFSGTVADIPVKPGDMVRVGELLMTVEEEGAAAAEAETAPPPEPEEKPEEPEEPEKEAAEQPVPKEPEEPEEAEKPAAPSREERPEEKPEERPPEPAERPAAEAREDAAPQRRAGGPVPAVPATRRLARELGVDLRAVEPSGPDGRVTDADVRAHAEGRRERPAAPAAAEAPAPAALPDFERWGPVERRPLRSLRRATAKHMALSWSQIPHVTHQDLVDITELERFRQRHEADVEAAGGKLTVTVFAVKAAAAALAAFPTFNASYDAEAEEVILKQYVHIGVALDSDRGLMVPVLRDVDRKSVAELAVELTRMSDRLRDSAPSSDDLRGGTFSVTNVGGLGGTGFTPIVNHPQVAILGLARARLEQVVTGTLDAPDTAVRLMLPVCVAFDHRVNDGADAARFTSRIAQLLADPERFALSV